MKIGIVREGKVPPDQRVPLTPDQCAELKRLYPEVELVVESSDVRRIKDEEYREAGIDVVNSLQEEGCDVLLGVKEVPTDELIEDTTYLFFSHTYKLQPYNAKLLKAIVDKRVKLIDYELIKRANGRRVIGFRTLGRHRRGVQRHPRMGVATRLLRPAPRHRLQRHEGHDCPRQIRRPALQHENRPHWRRPSGHGGARVVDGPGVA